MAEQNANQDSLISDSLHPLVNMAIIGLVLMFVAAVWMFFDSDTYEAWLDVVITGLFVIEMPFPHCVGLPGAGMRTVRGTRVILVFAIGPWANSRPGPVPSKGANATAEVLLPIAAVAVGMTVLGLAFPIIASGGA